MMRRAISAIPSGTPVLWALRRLGVLGLTKACIVGSQQILIELDLLSCDARRVMSPIGTSRHLAALRNLVAIGAWRTQAVRPADL